jgi:hypothetical protein
MVHSVVIMQSAQGHAVCCQRHPVQAKAPLLRVRTIAQSVVAERSAVRITSVPSAARLKDAYVRMRCVGFHRVQGAVCVENEASAFESAVIVQTQCRNAVRLPD